MPQVDTFRLLSKHLVDHALKVFPAPLLAVFIPCVMIAGAVGQRARGQQT
jgi:hypothetical protein